MSVSRLMPAPWRRPTALMGPTPTNGIRERFDMDIRTRRLLEAPLMPTLARMAAPNILVMMVQTSIGLIETYFVALLGTDALAGMALVFPVVMLVQMLSAGGMGGGIQSAVSR